MNFRSVFHARATRAEDTRRKKEIAVATVRHNSDLPVMPS